MAATRRERITIDLRGLAPALHAHARARHLTVTAMARSALVAALEDFPLAAAAADPGAEHDATTNSMVKLTLRLHRGAARRLTTCARAAGLPYGAYLATLLDGTPAPALAADHEEAVTALGVSTEQLAVISGDLNEFIRLVRHGKASEARRFADRTTTLVDDVRQHLALASRLMAALKPAAAWPRRRSRTRPNHWQQFP